MSDPDVVDAPLVRFDVIDRHDLSNRGPHERWVRADSITGLSMCDSDGCGIWWVQGTYVEQGSGVLVLEGVTPSEVLERLNREVPGFFVVSDDGTAMAKYPAFKGLSLREAPEPAPPRPPLPGEPTLNLLETCDGPGGPPVRPRRWRARRTADR